MTTPTDDFLPITVLIPETASSPVVIYDQTAALRLAVVERNHVHKLGSEWDVPGVYVLLDPSVSDGTFSVYVGKAAPGGMRQRLISHSAKKDHWRRALLIRRDTAHGFDSAQIGWLEGRLYDLFAASELATLHNRYRPSDETLPSYERIVLEASSTPIQRVLRLLGHIVQPPQAVVLGKPGKQPPAGPVKHHEETLRDLLGAGLLQPGMNLVSTNGAWPAEAEVTATGLVYQGQMYTSPSGAARVVKGGAANGWRFWAVKTESGEVTLFDLRQQLQAKKASEA